MGAVAALVIAGGAAQRFGEDKLAITRADGATLLEVLIRGLESVDIRPIVVVGPERDLGADVIWTREEPPGGGPGAALIAGLACIPADAATVIVLAGDAPAGARAVDALLLAREGAAGSVLVDAQGREQPISAAYDVALLREVLEPYASGEGISVRLAIEGLRATGHVIVGVTDEWGAADDVDIPADAARLGFMPSQARR